MTEAAFQRLPPRLAARLIPRVPRCVGAVAQRQCGFMSEAHLMDNQTD
jgi:hypothetical protein